MQYIDLTRPNIIAAKDVHFSFMSYIIKKKLLGTGYSGLPPKSNMNQINKVSGVKASIHNFLIKDDNLRDVLIGSPDVLEKIKDKFSSRGEKKSLNLLLNYDSWCVTKSDSTYRFYNAYNLAENLDIPTCIYCNRIYTKTVTSELGKKVTRPTFDHWFPQSEYPLLALSFHNLIPSCSVCNSGVKGSATFSLNTHFHPYYKYPGATFDYKFSYTLNALRKYQFRIKTPNSFSENSVKAFALEDIFKAHEDEISDLIRIKETYSDRYIQILEDSVLKTVRVSKKEVYRLAFGVHFHEKDFDRRPLSKMKKDILTELGVI
ncbi:hypothetical protein LQ567_11040 [Niabella pedocola]|uniref:HNH endonuclease n=1 Tax=Niabella pedocola TaxID=1752077 RepID=A0ABS8PQC5_9BACT|nr:hypothetical protein [Niabella pedocola]MCD2423297.1 hypothetical protein [Niabella pedocola]